MVKKSTIILTLIIASQLQAGSENPVRIGLFAWMQSKIQNVTQKLFTNRPFGFNFFSKIHAQEAEKIKHSNSIEIAIQDSANQLFDGAEKLRLKLQIALDRKDKDSTDLQTLIAAKEQVQNMKSLVQNSDGKRFFSKDFLKKFLNSNLL